MPVCLHCGEIAPDGALFCGKCGYTLPQPGADAAPAPVGPTAAARPPPVVAPPAPAAVAPPVGTYLPAGPYAVRADPVAGAVPPIPPPPNAKYCTRCATPIARAAVFCPVCQQPQP